MSYSFQFDSTWSDSDQQIQTVDQTLLATTNLLTMTERDQKPDQKIERVVVRGGQDGRLAGEDNENLISSWAISRSGSGRKQARRIEKNDGSYCDHLARLAVSLAKRVHQWLNETVHQAATAWKSIWTILKAVRAEKLDAPDEVHHYRSIDSDLDPYAWFDRLVVSR